MKETIILFLSATIAGIGWLLKNEREKRREVEKQLSDKKYAVYSDIISLFFETIKNTKTDKKIEEGELLERMFTIMQNLIVYGSDSVVKKFSTWKREAGKTNPIFSMKMFTNILIEIRKDMGHPETKVDITDIWGMMITDYETFHQMIAEDEVLS